MKRCPECEFLYENESIKCDMDGTPLRFTATLPALPGFARTICDKWTISLVALLVLGTVLVVLYRATPRAYTSSTPTHARPAERPSLSANQNDESLEPPATPTESSSQLEASDDTSGPDDTSASVSTSTALNSRKAKRSAALPDEKEPTPVPVTHINAASTAQTANASSATPQPPAAESTAEIGVMQPPASSTNATPIHPLPPVTNSNKPAIQSQKKDSGLKSFLKKAGKVLKKPFGEN